MRIVMSVCATASRTWKSVTGGNSSRALAAKGSVWLAIGYAISSIARLASNVVMTRLLFPEAFGLMSLVQTFIKGLGMFSDVGIQPNIVQNPDGDKIELLNTAWTIQIVRGFALFAVSLAGAYPFALIYQDQRLFLLISVASFNAVLAGLQSTKLATASRHLDQKGLVLTDLICQIVAAVCMVAAAWWTQSEWALVVGMLVSGVVRLALSHFWFKGYHNRIQWDAKYARNLIRFGRWVFISTILTFLVQQADRLVFAKMIPLQLLGVYSVALSFSMIPQQLIWAFGRSIAFPVYSRAFRSRGEFRSEFYSMRESTVIGVSALLCAMVASAQPMVDMLYDERYSEAGWMLQMVSVGIWFQILECHASNGLLALGRSRVLAIGGTVKLVGMLIMIPAGYHFFGFPGALAGYSASDVLRYFLTAVVGARSGLSTWGEDAKLSLVGIASILAGVLMQNLVESANAMAMVEFAFIVTTVFLVWISIYFRTLLMLVAKFKGRAT